MPGVRYFRCPRCARHTFSLKSLFRHLHTAHGHEGHWVCGLSGCMQSFRIFPSYKKHIYRKHAELLAEDKASPGEEDQASAVWDEAAPVDVAASQSDMGVRDLAFSADDTQEQASEAERAEEPTSGDYVKQLALLLLKWKEQKRLPESTVHEIANDVILYVKNLFEYQRLQDYAEMSANVKELLCDLKLDQLLTKCGRNAFWKTHLPLIEPQTIVLGVNSNGKSDLMTYVPLCRMLKFILENSACSAEFNSSIKKKDGYLCSVFDGTAFAGHAYFQGDTSRVCLQLYSDEFDVCNPLGSKRGKHKMTAVYFSVLNFSAQFRSTLPGIYLVLLVKDKHVSTYGLPKILEPLLQDIRELENDGIIANGQVMKGSIFVMTGDNLSSHRVGGFQCRFNHGRICRFCMAVLHEIKHKLQESDFLQRTPAGHQHHINMLNAGLPTASLYGVKAPCAITSQGFEPTEHFPPDVMHDIHEGILPLALKHIIGSLISQGFFSLKDLNRSILDWNYDQCDAKNRPEAITPEFLHGNAKMKQSASQVFCLFHHLSFFVGDSIPSENKTWHLYLLLRKICDILLCHNIPVTQIAYLQRKITFFLQDFHSLFPNVSYLCKMHYLIHYASCIQKFGPLVDLWAMRFEAKHQYFKDLSRKIRNFKNLTHSLSMRHQFYQSFCFIAGDQKGVSTTGCRPIRFEHLPDTVKEFIIENNFNETTSFTVKSGSADGRVYKVGSVLVHSVPEDALPEFLQECDIFYVHSTLLVLAKLLETIRFDEHFHAYVVSVTNEQKILTSLSRCEVEPLYVHQHRGYSFISPRHSLL
ncbi:uncharacterized protein LOC144144139 [Haemaphysalis longicornis]